MSQTNAANSVIEIAEAVVGLDEAGRLTEFDDAAEKMFGQPRSEVLGRLAADVMLPPAFRTRQGEDFKRYLAPGEANLLGKRVELSAVRRDGTTFPIELAITCADARNAQSFTGFIRDISERKESEHFRLLVAAIKDHAIFMLDAEGRVATWNAGAQSVKGYTQSEIVGRHFSIFYSADDRASRKPEHELEIAEAVGRFEERGWRVRKDRSEFWANVLISAIKDGDGKLVGFAKVTRDLTAQRKAERPEELEVRRKSDELGEENRRMHEANRLKSEFLANMSHELRTPLNAIIGFAQLMVQERVGPVSRDHKEYLGDILASSRHLLELINGVLDLAKVESGKMEFRPEPVDLNEVITQVSDIVRGLASTKRIRIETKVDASIASAVLDPSKLKQVLYNYLSNALKFTPEEGLVTIQVVPEEGDRIRIEVQDTGIGIRREDTHRLFVEFQQLDAGMAKRHAGTGLGLALTRRIVEAQGGSVGVTSEPGKGSTFWAVIPRTTSELHVDSITETPATQTPAALQNTVLVVDDDPAALRLMAATLKAHGYTALCFADPAEALREIEKTTPAVVVLDVLMPVMDGFALLDRLRAIPHMRGVPVVVWTVKDLSEAERKRLLLGAQRIVLKAHGESEAIVDALKPYLDANPNGDAHAG